MKLLMQTPVLILAGGLGTRLKSVVPDRPKGLAPIGDYTFLSIQLQLLRDQGARSFILCVGYHADQIQQEFGNGEKLGIQIEYSVESEERLLGTAGALRLAERYFAPRALVLNGDTYYAIDYEKLIQHHVELRHYGVIATLALTQIHEHNRYGNVILDQDGKFVTQFLEKQAAQDTSSMWVSAGAYVIERGLLAFIPPGQPASLEREVFPRLLSEGGKLGAYKTQQPFFDIGTPEAWRSFTDFFLEKHNGECAEFD